MNKGLRTLGGGIFVFCALVGMKTFGAPEGRNMQVQFPSGPAAWEVSIVTLKPSPTPESANGQTDREPWVLKAIEVTRSRGLTRSRFKWANGKSSEIWWTNQPKAMLAEKPDGAAVEFDSMLVGIGHLLPDSDMFGWVREKNFVKEIEHKGKRCLYFEDKVEAVNQVPGHVNRREDAPQEVSVTLHRAWIDTETGLPVALDDGQNIYSFQFLPPPTTALVLPERFQAEWDRAWQSAPDPKFLGKQRSWK